MANFQRYKLDDFNALHSFMARDPRGEWVKFADVAEALKPSHNSAITPPLERDCDTCENDGGCFEPVLRCKGYIRAAQ